jgi:ribosomal-protein-serine acetyltransferase
MFKSKEVIVVDNDLSLKFWDIEHSSALFRLTDQNRLYLQPWLPWVPKVKTEDDSIKFISRAINDGKNDEGLELGVWYKNSLVGCIGLNGLSKSSRRASIGYWLSHDYQKKGIMTRSVKSLIGYSFNTLDLNRISIEACVENVSSCAIAERLGFVKEGIVRQFEYVDGRYLDYQVYSVLKSEWK